MKSESYAFRKALRSSPLTLIICLLPLVGACSDAGSTNTASVKFKPAGTNDVACIKLMSELIPRLAPLYAAVPKPGPYDWLAQHKERGQTFKQYLAAYPVRPDNKRKVLYIQPMGDFTKAQNEIVKLSAEYMGIVFGLEAKIQESIPLSKIPADARRKHPSWGMDQILSTYVLDEVLAPEMPEDAVVRIAFTATDLWPGEGWNFVFGQASLRERVGVWSIYRNGDPDKSKEEFALCLRRTIKTATHETGHMFTMLHCIAYSCNMCGSNNLPEADRQPLAFCPECFAKLCYACRLDPAALLTKQIEFFDKHNLKEDAAFHRKLLGVVAGPDKPKDAVPAK